MQRVSYFFFYIFVQIVSRLPFCMLYMVSDLFYFLCYHVVRYRRKVVAENLRTSFPEYSDDRRKKIEKEAYQWFCDVILEGIKAFRMDVEELDEHVKYENMELMRSYVSAGKSVIMDMAHTGMWEWIPSIYLKYFPDIVGAELYRHVKNKYMDELFLKQRERFKTLVIPKDKAIFPLARVIRDKKVFAVGLLADQTPSRSNLHYWTDFLNHDTAFLQGPERMARMFKAAVVYIEFERIKRGYYICRFVDITGDASKEEDGFVTKKYANLLEASIRRNPERWFWTHRRWKYDHATVMREDAEKEQQKSEEKKTENNKEAGK